jgi:acyl phosphate:glycerol-3-phosphate acyltransferase
VLVPFAAVIAYLIGSFPTAYVIGKFTRGIDVSRNGTGNIGAMNAYEVTGSRTIGIAVGIVDILKGLLVVMVAQYQLGLTASVIAASFAVLGHNYSIFMKFKGGRGLATAAGSLLIIEPLSVIVYLLVYFSFRAAKLKLYLSSVFGIIAASIPILIKFIHLPACEAFATLLLIAVLSRHLVPLRNELRNGT